jgi:predicted HTH transcriptional regulator
MDGLNLQEKNDSLIKQIALGEDSVLELKQPGFSGGAVSGPHRNSMADELAAMANSRGGTVVLGVDDKTHEIIGIPHAYLDGTETWLRSIVNDLIKPPLDCRIKKQSVIDRGGVEKYIIKIEVPRSIFVHKSPDGYFTRIGSSKREMPPDVLARLFQQRSQNRLIRFDEQIVANARSEDLDKRLYDRFRTPLSPQDDMEFLLKLKLLSTDEEGTVYPTIGGILMASPSPEAFVSNAYIQAVCCNGTGYDAEQLDALDITGPLDIQIKEACKFVKRNMRVRAIKDPGRIETPQFALSAVFEAIVNAAAHRKHEKCYEMVVFLVFRMLGLQCRSEVRLADGRIDALVETKRNVYCFEFKLDKSADEALKQIDTKEYLLPWRGSGKKLFKGEWKMAVEGNNYE